MSEQRKPIIFDTSKITAAIQKAYEAEHPEELQELPDELFKILDYLPSSLRMRAKSSILMHLRLPYRQVMKTDSINLHICNIICSS
jgi:hypothetical protein